MPFFAWLMFQAHPALETISHFRLIPHWKRPPCPGSSRIGQFSVCGIPVFVMLMVGVVQLFYQFWPHTQLIGGLGFLDRWIQTPSNHRVHHAQNDIYLDKNYVGVFLIWDRLFGSFQEELDEEPCIYGIRGQLNS